MKQSFYVYNDGEIKRYRPFASASGFNLSAGGLIERSGLSDRKDGLESPECGRCTAEKCRNDDSE